MNYKRMNLQWRSPVSAISGLAVAVALLLIPAGPAHAENITYFYTGHPFSGCYGEGCAGDSTSNFISVGLTFASALPDNLFNDDYFSQSVALPTLVSWSITDNGSHTFSSAASDTLDALVISTDASGDIFQDYTGGYHWLVEASPSPGGEVLLETYGDGSGCCGNSVDFYQTNSQNGASNSRNPGTWAFTPEPATWVLAGSGLLLAGWRRRKSGRLTGVQPARRNAVR